MESVGCLTFSDEGIRQKIELEVRVSLIPTLRGPVLLGVLHPPKAASMDAFLSISPYKK